MKQIIIIRLLKALNKLPILLHHLLLLLLSQLHRLLMLNEPFTKELEPLQVAGHLALLGRLFIVGRVHVAAVEAAGLAVVFAPVLHAEPAELVGAGSAGHVHAAFVFLYWSLAFWALFGSKLNPGLCKVVTAF